MKKTLYAAIPIIWVAFGSSALTADMSVKAPKAPPPAVSWTGFYVGGQIGHIWGATTVEDNGIVTDRNAPTHGTVGGVKVVIRAGHPVTMSGFLLMIRGPSLCAKSSGSRAILVATRHASSSVRTFAGSGRWGKAAALAACAKRRV
jgi:opacity protein-like surface antigen